MKNDYNKNSFWVLKDDDGNPHYYIKIDGVLVPVSKDVYKVCRNSYMKIIYDNKKDSNKIISLDSMNERYQDFIATHDSNSDNELLENIKLLIQDVDQPYQEVLLKYFFEGKNLIEIANEMSVSKSTISNWVAKGIKILKKVLEMLEKE